MELHPRQTLNQLNEVIMSRTMHELYTLVEKAIGDWLTYLSSLLNIYETYCTEVRISERLIIMTSLDSRNFSDFAKY